MADEEAGAAAEPVEDATPPKEGGDVAPEEVVAAGGAEAAQSAAADTGEGEQTPELGGGDEEPAAATGEDGEDAGEGTLAPADGDLEPTEEGYEEDEAVEPDDLGDEDDGYEGGEGYGDFDMLEAAEVDADEEQVEEDKANLAELFKQAQEEKATFLDLNQVLQKKLAEHLRTSAKKMDESKDIEKSVTDQEQRYYKFLAQVNELRDELKRLQQQHDKTAMEMKRRLDDKQSKAEEIKAAFVEFKREEDATYASTLFAVLSLCGKSLRVRKAGEETKGQQRKGKKAEDGWALEDEWEADDKESGALPAASRDDVPTPSQASRELDEPLGGRLTRIGLGTRRRALLRSERALACHAGALHDLRVALREAGGEWLELGRWVGGPPLASMPWDVQPSRTQHEYLLRICARVASQLRATAATLHRLGPYALYSEPFPRGSVDVEPLASRRATLVAATRDALDDLWMVRKAVREGRPPPALLPPNVFARHSLVWAALLLILVDGYAPWLPVLLAARHDAIKASIKVAADARRFWSTHVTEPLGGIARELFHGYESTIDKAQVAQTKAALARMLQEFVRDTHPSSSDLSLEEALRRAGQGSMEAVTIAFESQVKAPVSSLLNGQLIRSMLLLVQQLRLLMEEEVEAIDSMLKRNDFNMQLMATLPALMLMSALLWLLRTGWRKVRSADRALRDPLDTMQAEVLAIDALLIGAEWTPQRAAGTVPRFQRDALSQFEVTPMELGDVGEIVFRVQRLRKTGAQWLRGIVRREMLQDAQVLLDSARLSATQRSRVAQSLLRRFDNFNSFRDYW